MLPVACQSFGERTYFEQGLFMPGNNPSGAALQIVRVQASAER
jgi:hypothetical protein